MTATESPLPGPRVDDLTRVVERPGPFASVVSGYAEPSEDSEDRRALHWRELRTDLVSQGAPDAVTDAIEPHLLDVPGDARAVSVVATADGVQLVSRHLERPTVEYARWARLPSLAPVVEWRQLTPPHLVALVDRRGADLHVANGGVADLEVTGNDDVLHKPSAGGWSQRRIQARAEDSFERNADQIAETVTEIFDAVGARVLVISGDERELGLVRGRLPERVRTVTEVVEGGSRDEGLDSVAREVIRYVGNAAAEDTVAFLGQLKRELEGGDRAVEGAAATLEALSRAQVMVLGIHDDPDDQRTASFGPEPWQVSSDRAALVTMGVDQPQEGRLPDVAIRAALLSGSAIRVLPWHAGPRDGIAALLRWGD